MSITGIYPLEVGTNVSSFLTDESMRIYFSLGSNTTDKQIRFIHVSIKKQTTGKSIFKILQKQIDEATDGSTVLSQYSYPDLLTFAFLDADVKDAAQQVKSENNGTFYIDIPVSVTTASSWDINSSYLVQIRGDITTDKNPIDYCYYDGTSWQMADSASYADYFNNVNNFIEWSNTVQKFPIGKPILDLDIPDIVYPWNTDFKGKVIFTDDNREKLIKYQAWVEDSNYNEIDNTEEIFTSSRYDANEIIFNLNLISLIGQDISNEQYTLNIWYETQHGYETIESIDLNIQNCEKVPDEYNVTFSMTLEEDLDDFGIVEYSYKANSSLPDNTELYLLRLDSISNKVDIIISGNSTGGGIDPTCEPLRMYTYWLFVKIDDTYYYTDCKKSISVQSYSPTLCSEDGIVKLSYDFQVSSDNPNTRLTKVDTIGGKYPYFSTNAAADYHSFPIQGKIAVEDNYTEDGELSDYLWFLQLPEETLAQYKKVDGRNSNYSNYNFLLQREYRKGLMLWLNNGKPKLLRYLPIGNYIVMLTDISLTPETNLSSLIWDFSATAYEIGDGTDFSQIRKYVLS